MSDKKVCPMLTIMMKMQSDCIENECAWYNPRLKGCAIFEMSFIAENIVNR